MLVRIANLLTPEEVTHCRQVLQSASWGDGKVTAGTQSATAKFNLQVPEDSEAARTLGDLILGALGRNAEFITAALPARVFPPLFNRYDVGMKFDAHVDNAIRNIKSRPGFRIRTDVSATVFLTAPEDYDGGDLVVQDTFGEHRVKLPAGDMVIYPSTSLHRVEPITRGSRWASFFWIESMVKEDAKRAHLYDLDKAIQAIRADLSDEHQAVRAITASYHNLLRLWAEM